MTTSTAPADVARERELLDFFLEHPLTDAVRDEIGDFIDISDVDVAWIVEATLWQLRRITQSTACVDLDYLGLIRRHVEISINRDALPDESTVRTRACLIWDQRP